MGLRPKKNEKIYRGGCHCGAVQFEIVAPPSLIALDCNCSICSRSGFLHIIVHAHEFELLCGESELNTYTFNTNVAQHRFCCHCGVKSFYVPRSHPDAYSVNYRCLDIDGDQDCEIEAFDGANWETSISTIGQ